MGRVEQRKFAARVEDPLDLFDSPRTRLDYDSEAKANVEFDHFERVGGRTVDE